MIFNYCNYAIFRTIERSARKIVIIYDLFAFIFKCCYGIK